MYTCFAGKRALVTGAGKGFGRQTAVPYLAEFGAQVLAISRTEADLVELKLRVPSIETICLDIADWDATREAVEGIKNIDFLVNNAGITLGKKFTDFTKEDYDKVNHINVRAAFNISQVVVRDMIENGAGGSIVNISSILGHRVMADFALCCMAKAALDMMTMSMANDLGSHKIPVNTVKPTFVYTNSAKGYLDAGDNMEQLINKTPVGKLPEIKDIVDTILYLLSDKAAMVTGQAITVDGGMLLHI